MANKSSEPQPFKKPSRNLTPVEYIAAHGQPVATVVSIWSAGESDLGGETYLFLDPNNKPWTAVEIGDNFYIHEGWNWFNPTYAEAV